MAYEELQRILNEAEAQSRDYVAQVNAQAAAIIADANEKAANLVAAAYKDAQAAQQKADEIIAQAKVDMQNTQNAIALFKQSALASLGQLLPMVQAIKLDDDAAAQIETAKSADLPTVEAQSAQAPSFDLNSLFETFDMSVEKDRAALAEELAPVVDLTEEESDGGVIEIDEAEVPEEEPEEIAAPMQAETREVEEMPVYHPFVAPNRDLFTTSLFDQVPAEEDVEDVSLDEADDAPAAATFDETDVTDEPQPLKFKLTQNFDIFDEEDT